MARWRIVVGVGIVAALAVVTAFVVADALRGEPEVIASEPAGAAASATAMPTSDADPTPELHNTGDDFDRIIRSIEEFRSWLYRNPNPELAQAIYDESCTCLADLEQRLEQLLNADARFEQNETVVHEVSVLDRAPPYMSLRVIDEGKIRIVTNNAGEELDRSPGWAPRTYRFLLIDRDGRWLVSDIVELEADAASPRKGT